MVSIGSRRHGALRLLHLAPNGGLGVAFGPVAPVLSEPLLDTHPEWTALIP